MDQFFANSTTEGNGDELSARKDYVEDATPPDGCQVGAGPEFFRDAGGASSARQEKLNRLNETST